MAYAARKNYNKLYNINNFNKFVVATVTKFSISYIKFTITIINIYPIYYLLEIYNDFSLLLLNNFYNNNLGCAVLY